MNEQIIKYVEDNPYMVYGDRNDELPLDMAQALIDGDLDKFNELWCDIELSYYDYLDMDYYYKELMQDLDLEKLSEDQKDCIRENLCVDASDLLRTCFNHSRFNIVVTPYKTNGEPIDYPSYDFDKEYNAYLKRYHAKTHGINTDQSYNPYGSAVLKLAGRLDLEEVYENLKKGLKLHAVRIDSNFSNVLTHSSWNGSGGEDVCIQTTKPSKKYYPARFIIDNKESYGVQAVYGLTNDYWENGTFDVKYK